MKKIVVIEGLKCKKCAKHIDEVISCLSGVSSVKTNYETSQAVVICKPDLSDKMIEDAVNKAGYKFVSLTSEQDNKSVLSKLKSFIGL